ncbi:hypothetical protein O6H91_Y547500 [Diphasiastrum complanatum]|nr:hypothetical protein O6H91_Y547500 [Diphasiastrum complanatum]
MQQPLEKLIGEIIAKARPESPKVPVCIISDMLMSWTQDVANKYGIPRYVIYPGLAVSMAWVLYLPILQAHRGLPLKSAKEFDTEEDFITVPGLPPSHRREWNTLLLDTFPRSAQEVYVKNCLRTHEASGILVDTFEELESAAISALETATINPKKVPIYAVGPLLEATHSDQPDLRPADANCLRWLDNQPPSSVVYVCFGSAYDPTETQIQELALGLQHSDQLFLWVLRPGPGRTTGTDLSSFLPEEFLSRTHKQGLVLFDWAPQHLILSHPSIGAFFSHCGYNSMLETITMGLPVIGFPQFADHHLNCKLLVEELGMGVEACRRESDGLLERREVERTVRLAMVKSEQRMSMRRKAKEWRDMALKAVTRMKAEVTEKNRESSKRSLESFIEDMLHTI